MWKKSVHVTLQYERDMGQRGFRLGFWKLRYIRRGVFGGKCCLCSEEENEIHTSLKCKDTERWAEKFLNDKWLRITDDIAINGTFY